MKATTDIKRPALRYYGGKWRLAPWIISYFPEHKNYVEPCGGAASVMLQKPRSLLETYNDIDLNVVNFFRMLRDRPDDLLYKIRFTPWAKVEHDLAWQDVDDELEKARRFFVRLWTTVHGSMHEDASKTFRVQRHVDDRYRLASADLVMAADSLVQIAERFKRAQIENMPAIDCVLKYDHSDTLIYLDPPYVLSGRSRKKGYIFEWSEDDHSKMAEVLYQVDSLVVISGYACPLYAGLYTDNGWHRVDKEVQTNSGSKRIESLWLSPRTWEALNTNLSGLPLFDRMAKIEA